MDTEKLDVVKYQAGDTMLDCSMGFHRAVYHTEGGDTYGAGKLPHINRCLLVTAE